MGTELLIPFIASVLITILLRRLDKSNYRLSQIKRYTQKLTEEINDVAISKIQSVKDAGIDLEIMNKQAKKLSEEIQKVSSDTKILLETVKSNKSYLDNVSTELSGVVELTGEIQKESAYIQNGLSLFQSQRNEIEKIEKEILKIQSEASGILLAFNEKVNIRTDEVLQSLATKIVEMESLLESKSDKLDEFAENVSVTFQEKLKEEIEILARESVGKVEFLHSKISSLTDSLKESEKNIDSKIIQFRDFSDIISEKMDRVDLRLNDKFEFAEKKIEERLIGFEKQIQDRFDLIVDQVTQSKDAFIRGLKMEIESIRREIEGLDLETMTRRDEILNETRRQAESINSNIALFQEKYLEAENKLLRQADIKKSELMRQIDLFEEEFYRVSASLKEEAETLKNTVMGGLQNFETDLESVRSGVSNSVKSSLMKLKDELEKEMITLHDTKTEGLKNSLSEVETKVGELKNDTQKKIKLIDEHFEELKSALQESAKEILKDTDTKAKDIFGSVEDETLRMEERLENIKESWFRELEKIKADTKLSVDSLEDRLKDIHVEGSDLLEKFSGEYENGKQRISQFCEIQENTLKSVTENLLNEIQTQNYEARKESEKILQELESTAVEFFDKQEEKIERLNATIDTKISKQLAALTDKGELQLGKLEEKVSKYIQDVRRNVEDSLRFTKEDTSKQIDGFNKEIQKHFREMERTNHNFIESTRKEFEKTKSEISSVQFELSSNFKEFENERDSLLSELNRETNILTKKIDSIAEKLTMVEGHSELFINTQQVISDSERTIDQIGEMLEKIRLEEKGISEYLKNSELLNSLKQEMELELRKLDIQRIKIEELEDSIHNTQGQIEQADEKIKTIDDKFQKIAQFDAKLKNVDKIQSAIDEKISLLEFANTEISKLNVSLDSRAIDLSEMEEQFSNLKKEILLFDTRGEELRGELRKIDQKTTTLLQKDAEIKSVEAKFEQIESLMIDLSERHKQVSTLQRRMEELKSEADDSKTELESLLSEADEKFNKLSAFLDTVDLVTSSEKQSRKKNTEIQDDEAGLMKKKKSTVLHLYNNFQWNSEVIAEKLNLEKSLVDSIINSAPTDKRTLAK
ncbi:MAG: hypothetical protein L6Q54_02035 [Leptospiraceae bacterium]|nr:hypothetical protein [Leptospiraceae bacterium]MCK6380019.1 hypothetical protein [Leptospiraceae bacterium]NUM40322.1 hypothetical protein [Leptospiraceae bacterium]